MVLAVSAIVRLPCVRHGDDAVFSLRHLCYTDVYFQYGEQGLDAGAVPYYDPKPAGSHTEYTEYPVLTGLWMLLTARIAPRGSSAWFFWINQIGLGLLAAASGAVLGFLVGWRRALLFAAAPTLVFLGGISWDLLAVAPVCLALLFFSRGRDVLTGLLLGIGTAAKLYPVIAVPFLVLQRLREGRRREAKRLAATCALTVGIVNVPFAATTPRGWSEFFRYNSSRPADVDSGWFHLELLYGIKLDPEFLNVLSTALFLAGAAGLLAWHWREDARTRVRRAAPGISSGTATALLAALLWYLMVNKVWSPQHGLWLLPLWSLSVPLRTWRREAVWGTFQAMDLFVLVTRFWWAAGEDFGSAEDASLAWFQAAIFLRLAASVVLVVLLLFGRTLTSRPVSRRPGKLPRSSPVRTRSRAVKTGRRR